jgi:hypothetical protein
VDRELLSFNSIIKALYRTLRNYLEMRVLSMYLQDIIHDTAVMDYTTVNLR